MQRTKHTYVIAITCLILLGLAASPRVASADFRFVAWGDTKDGYPVLETLSPYALTKSPVFTLFAGDLELNGFTTSGMNVWKDAMNGGNGNGLFDITFSVRGNHDISNLSGWQGFYNFPAVASNVGASNFNAYTADVTYSFDYDNSHFVAMDVPGDVTLMTDAQLTWLNSDLTSAEGRGLINAFILFHGPAYCVGNDHCTYTTLLGNDAPSGFWTVMNNHPIVKALFAGHEHLWAHTTLTSTRVPSLTRTLEQFIVGASGAVSVDPESCNHPNRYSWCHIHDGYATVDVSGETTTVKFYEGISSAPSQTFIIGTGNQYTVSTSAGTNGSITPVTRLVSNGSTTTFTVTPNTGYSVGTVSGCGGSLVGTTFTTGAITGACTVSATFTLDQYTVSTSAGTGGSITPVSRLVSRGSTATFTVTSNTGYSIGAVSGCGGSLVGNTYTTGAITGICTVTASFTQNQYTVSTSAGTGGTIGPVSRLVSSGSTTTFTVTPNTGYSIGNVTGCGGSLVGKTFTTGPVTGVCTVTATFNVSGAPTAPALNSPALLSETTSQTPTLAVNASTDPNGDPITYRFETSTASNFSSIAASSSGITASNGVAYWTVSSVLSDNKVYYWRALATDGSLNSPWMPTANFFVNTVNDKPSDPAASVPMNNVHVATLTPTLSVTNAADVDIYDTLTYEFDVAMDGGFTNIVSSMTGIAQGSGGTTSWVVAPVLAENIPYYWRARARDNHNATSNWASASFFVSVTNTIPTAPALNVPANNTEVATFIPTLTVKNATDPDRDSLHYVFEIDTVNTFNSSGKQNSGLWAEGAGTTSWTPTALIENTSYYWRAKANDGLADGPWMAAASFFVNTVNETPTVPTLNNPSNGGQVTVLKPTFKVNAATDPDNDVLTYEYQVYSNSGLTTLVTSTVGAGIGWVVDSTLNDNTTYWWRARARDVHGLAGNWMTASSFLVNNSGYNDPPAITITKPAVGEPVFYGEVYSILWSAADPDSVATIALGYDTTGATNCNGTRITTAITEHNGPDSYSWNITNLAEGTYYIYATITDGTTAVCKYSASPLIKNDASGDVNGDGIVSVADALRALRIADGMIQPTPADMAHADVAPIVKGVPQPDGIIDIRDVVVILRKAVGLMTW